MEDQNQAPQAGGDQAPQPGAPAGGEEKKSPLKVIIPIVVVIVVIGLIVWFVM